MKESERISKVGKVLAKIKANEYRCALSGWSISPHEFELDHIVSMNDGGTDELDNLQAVHPLVNRAKGTMGNHQFIDMCIAVASYSMSIGSVGAAGQRASLDEIKQAQYEIRKKIPELLPPPHGN